MSFLKFLISKIFWKNVLIALIIGFLILWLTFFMLKIYTDHGEAYSVPDFTGLTLDEVAKITREKNLRFKIADSIYVTGVKRGTVVDQNPKPDFKVKANRRIFLTINAFTPAKTEVPDIEGYSLRQAKAILEMRGLKVGKLTYVPDIAKNYVLEQKFNNQEIEEGEIIIKGSEIDLVLGNGLGTQRTYIPDLTGKSLKEARDITTANYLNLGAIKFDESVNSSRDTLIAKVYRQYPVSRNNRSVRLGSFIDLWLTTDPFKIPDEQNKNQENNHDEDDEYMQ